MPPRPSFLRSRCAAADAGCGLPHAGKFRRRYALEASCLRTKARVSSIIASLTSRCVHARTRPPSRLRCTPWARISRIKSQDSVVLFADAAQVNTFQPPATPENPLLEEFYYVNATEPTTHFRHAGKAGAAFMDGHVDQLPPDGSAPDERLPGEVIGRLPASRLSPDW